MRVVAVDDRRAARLDAEKISALASAMASSVRKIFQMHRLDGGDDRDMRAHQPGQRRDLARMVHADLEHARSARSPGMRASDSGTPQ